jgi:hypothetical protein
MAGREQLVEQVAESGLEDLDLGLGHRHGRGPIILHGPHCLTFRRRPTCATGRRARVVVQIVRDRDARRSGFARASHDRSIAWDSGQKNGRCTRGASLRLPSGPQRERSRSREAVIASTAHPRHYRGANKHVGQSSARLVGRTLRSDTATVGSPVDDASTSEARAGDLWRSDARSAHPPTAAPQADGLFIARSCERRIS